MKECIIVELNRCKYIVIDRFDYNSKKYVLLSEIMPNTNIFNNHLDIYLYDEKNNCFEQIYDELEYNQIKNFFEKRLEKQGYMENVVIENMVKLKLIAINDNNYVFQTMNNQHLILNIEIFGDLALLINDEIYFNKDTIKEKITIRFGPMYSNEEEVMIIKRGALIYCLQRYYG